MNIEKEGSKRRVRRKMRGEGRGGRDIFE